MKEKEIEINGEKIKIALKLPKEEIEDNNIKIYLDDTIDLTKTIKEVKEETNTTSSNLSNKSALGSTYWCSLYFFAIWLILTPILLIS